MPEKSNPGAVKELAGVERCTCCVVGAGPAGMVLALLLARQGLEVTLLEAHQDFDRDFRGDTLHPSAMEVLDQMGLAERVLAITRARLGQAEIVTGEVSLQVASFAGLKSKFPFVAMVPQDDFLELLAAEAKRCSSFRLILGANARELIEEDGAVRGLIYRRGGELFELRCDLVVAADGRASRMRKASGLKLHENSPPMDVVWFRLPRRSSDEISGVALRTGHGELIVIFERGDFWQMGYVIVKGSLKALRQAGIEKFRDRIASLVPLFADRLEALEDWSDISVLAVKTGRLERWYREGLLLIGDAAHVMSPIGGVGINYAIQDAVAAANLLSEPLQQGRLEIGHLAAVQRRRQWPTRVIQAVQSRIQKNLINTALKSKGSFSPPWPLRMASRSAFFRRLVARFVAYGARPERLEESLLARETSRT